MNHISEYKSFYKEGDIVLVEYWYNDMICPVEIIEKKGRKYKISHNTELSKIKNAPDEVIESKDIIDHYR